VPKLRRELWRQRNLLLASQKPHTYFSPRNNWPKATWLPFPHPPYFSLILCFSILLHCIVQ
jgi:hypothetical protein